MALFFRQNQVKIWCLKCCSNSCPQLLLKIISNTFPRIYSPFLAKFCHTHINLGVQIAFQKSFFTKLKISQFSANFVRKKWVLSVFSKKRIECFLFLGKIGIVSRSGTLTYEARVQSCADTVRCRIKKLCVVTVRENNV